MYSNPFAAKLRAADDEIKELEHRRADLREQIAWAEHFDPEEELAEIERLRSDLETRTAELARLEAAISELEATSAQVAAETPGLELGTRLGLKFHRWFTAEHGAARARLAAHKQELADLQGRVQLADEQRGQVARDVAELSGRVFDKEQALARFRSFRVGDAEDAVAEIDGVLPLVQKRREDLAARAADVDRAVEAPLAELQKYESEVKDHELTISKLKAERSQLEAKAAEAEHFDERLSRAANSFERAKLHDECERRFGERSPLAALRVIRLQMRSLSSSIGDHEQRIERIRRNMAKTTQRITEIAEVAARDIDALIIDGNNCCYKGSDFIGLAALTPLTEKLAKKYAVTVVFDATIRRLLGVSDDELRAALPAAEVHVVASRSKADETILAAADEPAVWVVSNDRFGDYREKTVVKEGRVIRHEILRGRVLVHDLGVNEPLAGPGGR